MTRVFLPLACCLAILIISPTLAAQTMWERPSNPAYRVGVFVGDDSPEAQRAVEELSDRVDAAGGILIRQSPVATETDDDSSAWIQEVREKGEEQFFFGGPENARDYLESELIGVLDVTRKWMVDPSASNAFFEAGIFLARAYFESGEQEQGRAWMEKLVAALPAHHPDTRSVPPSVVEQWEESSQELESARARINIATIRRIVGCNVEINGASVDTSTITVSPHRTYLVGVECGRSSDKKAWWVSAGSGETFEMAPFQPSFAESQLKNSFSSWANRWHLDAVVYIGPGDCADEDDVTCVAARVDGEADEFMPFQVLRSDAVDRLVSIFEEGSALVGQSSY